MKSKLQVSVFVLGLVVFGGAHQAAAYETQFGNFSANVGATTDYRFRGISQSDESPAVSLGVDWEHNSGFYAGAWGSNVDFNDGDEAEIETDIYGGYKFDMGNGLKLDYGVIGYLYPGASSRLDYDYMDIKARADYGFSFANVFAAAYFSPDYSGTADEATYIQGGGSVPVADTGVTADASWGYQWTNDSVLDYSDWSLGATYNWKGVDFSARYVDTDLSDADCGATSSCDATGILSVAYKFN